MLAYNSGEDVMYLMDDEAEVVDKDDYVLCNLCGETMDGKLMTDKDGSVRLGMFCNCEGYQAFEYFMITQALNEGEL